MGTVTIQSYTTKAPITMIGEEAGICTGADTASAEKNYNRGLDCLKSRHGRTFEFPDVYMILDGYSARVIREWYTHIGGMPTRLQASTRYINYRGFDYVIPTSISRDDRALQAYVQTMESIEEGLNELEQLGIPREDSANCLPLAMGTKIVCKHNARNLIDMSHQRMCSRAYHEYRELFKDVAKALCEYSDEWKYIVEHYFKPKCEEYGVCTETRSCGRMKRKITDGAKALKVICVSGKAGSGKDTVGKFLYDILSKKDKRVLITHYADLVKYVCINYFKWDGVKDREGRDLLQRVGTDLVRERDENYWVDFISMMLDISGSQWDYVLIPDCRFPNEIERLSDYGFNVTHINVTRPEYKSFLTEEQKSHSSETALDCTQPDYDIVNDGTLDDLYEKTAAFVKENNI